MRFLREILRLAAACGLLLTAHGSALAWGKDGHRLVADLAYERLSPEVRGKVDALLAQEPGATLGSISTWADEVRSPSTAKWHYVNFPRNGQCRFERERDCPDGQCVVDAITRNVLALANGGSADDRLKAMKWVVHLVADVHQPFHAGFADDRGANLMQIRAFGRGSNLHALWDGGLIQNWSGGEGRLKMAVQEHLVRLRPEKGDARSWAEESCRIASRDDIYPSDRFIDASYTQQWEPVLAQRLAEASDRLATVLTTALSAQPRGLMGRIAGALVRR